MTNAILSTNKLAKFLRYSEAFVINPFVIARGCNHSSVFINRCLYHNCTEVYVGLGGNGKKKKKKKVEVRASDPGPQKKRGSVFHFICFLC